MGNCLLFVILLIILTLANGVPVEINGPDIPEGILSECPGQTWLNHEDTGAEGAVSLSLPSCSCLRQLFLGARLNTGFTISFSGAGGFLTAGFVGAFPGINCVEDENNGNDDESDGQTQGFRYLVRMIRDLVLTPDNKFIESNPLSNVDTYIYYKEGQTSDRAMTVHKASLTLLDKKKDIYMDNGKNEDSFKNVCESYPETSIQHNFQVVVNAAIMDNKGCPIAQGTNYTWPVVMNDIPLFFEEQLECGQYEMNVDLNTPDEKWATWFSYKFEINDNCKSDEEK